MASVRQFWLVNSRGESYDLNDKKHFLHAPSGLGYQKSFSATVLGNSEEITDETFNMLDVSGELLFIGQNIEYEYQYYDEYIEFIKYKPLELHYKTPNKIYGYYCDVVITSTEKSEVSPDGVLHCPIVIHRATQWKNDNQTKLAFAKITDGDGKNYNYTYDYHYAGTNLSNMSPISNNGTEDCPMVFEIVGTVTNPIFTLFQDKLAYGRIKLVGTFSYIRINSDDLDESIYLEDINGTPVAVPMNYQDLSSFDGETYYTWLKIKVGENVGTFTAANIDTFDGVIKITYEERRATI